MEKISNNRLVSKIATISKLRSHYTQPKPSKEKKEQYKRESERRIHNELVKIWDAMVKLPNELD